MKEQLLKVIRCLCRTSIQKRV